MNVFGFDLQDVVAGAVLAVFIVLTPKALGWFGRLFGKKPA